MESFVSWSVSKGHLRGYLYGNGQRCGSSQQTSSIQTVCPLALHASNAFSNITFPCENFLHQFVHKLGDPRSPSAAIWPFLYPYTQILFLHRNRIGITEKETKRSLQTDLPGGFSKAGHQISLVFHGQVNTGIIGGWLRFKNSSRQILWQFVKHRNLTTGSFEHCMQISL